jgi:hypothetical protein
MKAMGPDFLTAPGNQFHVTFFDSPTLDWDHVTAFTLLCAKLDFQSCLDTLRKPLLFSDVNSVTLEGEFDVRHARAGLDQYFKLCFVGCSHKSKQLFAAIPPHRRESKRICCASFVVRLARAVDQIVDCIQRPHTAPHHVVAAQRFQPVAVYEGAWKMGKKSV